MKQKCTFFIVLPLVILAMMNLAVGASNDGSICREVVDKGKKIYHQEEKKFIAQKKELNASVRVKARGLMKALKKLGKKERQIVDWAKHVPLAKEALERNVFPKLKKRFVCGKGERTFEWKHLKRCVSSWGEQELWLKGDQLYWTLKVRPQLSEQETSVVEKIDYPIMLGDLKFEKKQLVHLEKSITEGRKFPGLWSFLSQRSEMYTDCMAELDLGQERQVAQHPEPLAVPLEGNVNAASCKDIVANKRKVFAVLKEEYDHSTKRSRMKRERIESYLSRVLSTISKWGKFEWELVKRVSGGEQLSEEFQVFLGNSIYRIPCTKGHRLDTSFSSLEEDHVLKSCRAKKGYERVEFGIRHTEENRLVVGIWANWIDEKERELKVEVDLSEWEDEKETIAKTITELAEYSFPAYDEFDRALASQECE